MAKYYWYWFVEITVISRAVSQQCSGEDPYQSSSKPAAEYRSSSDLHNSTVCLSDGGTVAKTELAQHVCVCVYVSLSWTWKTDFILPLSTVWGETVKCLGFKRIKPWKGGCFCVCSCLFSLFFSTTPRLWQRIWFHVCDTEKESVRDACPLFVFLIITLDYIFFLWYRSPKYCAEWLGGVEYKYSYICECRNSRGLLWQEDWSRGWCWMRFFCWMLKEGNRVA